MAVSDDSADSPKGTIPIHTDTNEKAQKDQIETIVEPGAHILNIQALGPEGQDLQTSADGRTVLIPQPSSDPNDPLNWGPVKKNVTLLVISAVAFMPDFNSTIGVPAGLPQAVYVVL